MLGKGRFGLSAKGGVHYSWPRIVITDYERIDWDSLGNTNISIKKPIISKEKQMKPMIFMVRGKFILI